MKTIINRKILVGGLLLAILLSLIYQPNLVKAETAGEPNIDTESGTMNGALTGWTWGGAYGARISIVDGDGKVVVPPTDFFQSDVRPQAYVGDYYTKKDYGAPRSVGLTKVSNEPGGKKYIFTPLNSLPRLVAGKSSSTNLDQIITYFTDKAKLKDILSLMGSPITLEDLLAQPADAKGSEKLALMIEPLVMTQVTENGQAYETVMSATDAAAYDKSHDGILRNKAGSLTHQNLPFGLYLTHNDCGLTAYPDGFKKFDSSNNDTIIHLGLGVGLVTFGQTMVENPEKATLKLFLDKGSPEDETEPNGFFDKGIDTWIVDNVYAWKYASGVSNGTNVSANDILAIVKETGNQMYNDLKKKSPISGWKYNSTYVSEAIDGSDHRGLLYEGSDFETGWGVTHKLLPTGGTNHYFCLGYIDPTQKKKITIHYLYDGLEDLNEKKTVSGIEPVTNYALPRYFPADKHCQTTREHADATTQTKKYTLEEVSYKRGTEIETCKAKGQSEGSYWKTITNITSNVDVYVCYTSPQSYKATLQYVTENGKGLSGTLADNTTAKTQSITITEGTKVRGTEKFPVLNGTAYKTLTTSDNKEYEISKFSYQVNGSAAVVQSAGNTAASTFFGKELTVTNSITYQLIYKEVPPPDDKDYTITLHYVDESGNDLKAAEVISGVKKDTKFKITDQFQKLLTASNYETLTVGGKTYKIDTAEYQFAGKTKSTKPAGEEFSTFFGRELTMTANLDYYLVYKAPAEQVTVTLRFVDGSGKDLVPQSTTKVDKGSEVSLRSLFSAPLAVGAYDPLTVGTKKYELTDAKLVGGAGTDQVTGLISMENWPTQPFTFKVDSVCTLYYKEKEAEKVSISKVIIYQDADGNIVKQEEEKVGEYTKGADTVKAGFPKTEIIAYESMNSAKD